MTSAPTHQKDQGTLVAYSNEIERMAATVFSFLAAEMRALAAAADALPHGSTQQDALLDLALHRQASWAMIEMYWTDIAVATLEDETTSLLNAELFIAQVLRNDKEAAGKIWLFCQQVDLAFQQLLSCNQLSSDARIDVARAWEAYNKASGKLRQFSENHDDQGEHSAAEEGLLPKLVESAISFVAAA